MKNFGILLKKLRTDANLTQEEFSCKLRTTKSTISKWENGSSIPDTETILKLSAFFHISCDDLLHPTETLTHMASSEGSPTPEASNALKDKRLTEESSPYMSAPSPQPTPRYFIFTSKKVFLLCMLVFLLGMAIGIGIFWIFSHEHTFPAVVESNEVAYTLVEERNNVETAYGSAYELVYYFHSDFSREKLVLYADDVAQNWRSGAYTSSSEAVLIISFYKPNDDITDEYKAYFRAFYLKPQSQ